MFDRLRRDVATRWFDFSIRGVRATRPVTLDPSSNVILISQVWRKDLLMYLVGVKSFVRFLRPRRICVVADRLEPQHKQLLHDHVHNIEIIDLASADTTGFPKGGTWERLLTIVDLSSDGYVIQLDADTVTRAAPTEVIECARDNRSFTLGTSMGREVIDAVAASELVAEAAKTSTHVQVVAERALAKLRDPEKRYIRGNSAFAGFGRGHHSRATLKNFSEQMTALLGAEKWREWGSEQVASNFAVANAPSAMVLPFPKYRYYHPEAGVNESSFLHFMGTYRFAKGAYSNEARRALSELG